MQLTAAIIPLPDEPCNGLPLPQTFQGPAQLVDPSNEFRLSLPLRAAAATFNSYEILSQAAVAHLATMNGGTGDPQLGDALADLAITGRKSYHHFKANPFPDAMLKQMTAAKAALTPSIPASPADVASAVHRALVRAYKVAWAIRGPANRRAAIRSPLGWIAVSGEDDTPHRPVNVPAPPHEQYEIPVTVGGITVQTRFFIANDATGPAPLPNQPILLLLPQDSVPTIPAGNQVILFLHGHSSSAEEALPIIPEIISAGNARGTMYSVVSLDLPNSGYSERFEHTTVAPASATTYPGGLFDTQPIHTPILDFEENFVAAFVDALDLITPVKTRFAGVIGGSLGGNLGLRLGRSDITARPWLGGGIVSWSPASVWDPMIRDEIKRKGPDRCRDFCAQPETPGSRADYFAEVFDRYIDPTFVRATQPEFWYRQSWIPCKQLHIQFARVARREIYSPFFRQWHWRLAGEQLVYSHVDRVNHFDRTSPWRWELNTVRQLLAAGAGDNFQGSNIFNATQTLAGLMANTPGESLFLQDTGHSMHIERPAFLAGEIARFLDPTVATQQMSFQITCVHQDHGKIASVGGTNRTKNIPFQMTVAECINALVAGNGFFVIGSDGVQAAVHVVTRHAPKGPHTFTFIETVRDSSKPDNLLSLPEC